MHMKTASTIIPIAKNTISISAIISVMIFSGATLAIGQSFSCSRAQIPSEYAICNSENLIVLDERMAALFADKRVGADNTSAVNEISKDQGNWLKKRNECEQNFKCLEQQYKSRIQKLGTS